MWMHPVDLAIISLYMVGMLGVGYYFMRRNTDKDDYYLAGRKMGSLHIGLSVVATDVGGGFSIGLGGLGFAMGIAGSWMLFTGLVGAWLAAVILIPRVWKLGHDKRLSTFPEVFEHYYGARVALLAGIISAIGYLGFTSSQILAGAKLASAAFVDLNINTALLGMGAIVVVYTVMGGLKAVIHTDTIQWAILMIGLVFIGIPMAYHAVGGMEAARASLDPSFFDLRAIGWAQFVNWIVTIVPIWFVGMTLYQRVFACSSEKQAKRAWYLAGLFEWPVMAFMGVLLGLFARVAADQGMFAPLGFPDAGTMDAEMGLPLLLRSILPIGLLGLMISAYFSAIMSTADSCLMAASGNVVTDIIHRAESKVATDLSLVRRSQLWTFLLGAVALVLALGMRDVLSLMLYSYAFMVSGLLVPVIALLVSSRPSATAAFWSMLVGGTVTIVLTVLVSQAVLRLPLGLDPNVFGITASALVFISISTMTASSVPASAGDLRST
jgi:SSS family solute:Na+ symporter